MMVFFYAPDCEHSALLAPNWASVANRLQLDPTVLPALRAVVEAGLSDAARELIRTYPFDKLRGLPYTEDDGNGALRLIFRTEEARAKINAAAAPKCDEGGAQQGGGWPGQ